MWPNKSVMANKRTLVKFDTGKLIVLLSSVSLIVFECILIQLKRAIGGTGSRR